MTQIRGADLHGRTKIWYGILHYTVESPDVKWSNFLSKILRFFTHQQKISQRYTEYCFGRKIFERKQIEVVYSDKTSRILQSSRADTSIHKLFVFIDKIASPIINSISFVWSYIKVPFTYLCPYTWIRLY